MPRSKPTAYVNPFIPDHYARPGRRRAQERKSQPTEAEQQMQRTVRLTTRSRVGEDQEHPDQPGIERKHPSSWHRPIVQTKHLPFGQHKRLMVRGIGGHRSLASFAIRARMHSISSLFSACFKASSSTAAPSASEDSLPHSNGPVSPADPLLYLFYTNRFP